MFGLFTYLGCRYLLINVAKFSDKKEWVVTYNRADDFKCKLALLAQKGSRYRNLKNFTWIFSLFCQICDIMSPCKHFITHEVTNESSWKSKAFKTKIGAVLWKMSPPPWYHRTFSYSANHWVWVVESISLHPRHYAWIRTLPYTWPNKTKQSLHSSSPTADGHLVASW